MQDFLTITKALSDENRVRVLKALESGELCVCQIIELLGLAPSTVSKHMSILRQARLVEANKNGRWIYFRLAGGDASSAVAGAISFTLNQLGAEPRIRQDAKRLKRILKSSPVEVCKRQRESRDILSPAASTDSVTAR